jgi:hypothetical protein
VGKQGMNPYKVGKQGMNPYKVDNKAWTHIRWVTRHEPIYVVLGLWSD